MTKSGIATHVATQASLSNSAADRGVNAVFSTITDALANEEIVTVTGFGTFTIKKRQARQGRNPRMGENISIAASKVPSFKAGKTLRDAVR